MTSLCAVLQRLFKHSPMDGYKFHLYTCVCVCYGLAVCCAPSKWGNCWLNNLVMRGSAETFQALSDGWLFIYVSYVCVCVCVCVCFGLAVCCAPSKRGNCWLNNLVMRGSAETFQALSDGWFIHAHTYTYVCVCVCVCVICIWVHMYTYRFRLNPRSACPTSAPSPVLCLGLNN